MKSALCTLLIALLVTACIKTDVTPVIDNANPDWIRLTVPSGGEALNVAGNLDSTLFVATMFLIYRTSDQGRSWTMVRDRKGGPSGVIMRNDTVFLLANRLSSPTVKTASDVTEFSTDMGETWQKYQYRASGEPTKVLNRAEATNGSTYVIKENSTPIPNSPSAYVNPSTLLRESQNGTTPVAFPFKHIITAIQLDATNRLYVTASGEHIPETNRIRSGDFNKPAYLYISKRAFP